MCLYKEPTIKDFYKCSHHGRAAFVLAIVIHHTTEVYGTSATEPPAPLSSTATHSKRLHIRYIVAVWSWWHGQFLMRIQKAIAPTRIWRLPTTIQVSNITTDTWDKRRFGLSSLGTCSFLSPSLYTGCGSSQNLNKTSEYLLSFSRSVYLSGRVPNQQRYSCSWDRNWNGNSCHIYNTGSNYPVYYVMQRASKGTDTCYVSLVHVWTWCTLKQCIRSQWFNYDMKLMFFYFENYSPNDTESHYRSL